MKTVVNGIIAIMVFLFSPFMRMALLAAIMLVGNALYAQTGNSEVFRHTNGYFIGSGQKWREYIHGVNGIHATYDSYGTDDNYIYLFNDLGKVAIPRQIGGHFYMKANGESEWTQIYSARINNPQTTPTSVTSPESRSFTVKGVTFKMIKVEAGTFMMGQYESSVDCYFFDITEHKVILTSNYYIGQTEVTQALWKAVMGNNPSDEKGDNLPVESVTWYDCIDFINRLNSLTGEKFRLPTEAEWEYAARGGKKSKGYKCIGSNNASDVMWGSDNTGVHIKPVGTKKPNELGLYNMAGNVSEWCQDWKGKYPKETQYNPTGPSKENSDNGAKICRGESIHRPVCYGFAMPAVRNQDNPLCKDYGTGLRLVMDE